MKHIELALQMETEAKGQLKVTSYKDSITITNEVTRMESRSFWDFDKKSEEPIHEARTYTDVIELSSKDIPTLLKILNKVQSHLVETTELERQGIYNET